MPENLKLKLINSTTYKRLKPFLVAGFLLSYFLSFVFMLPLWVIIILTVLSIFIPVFLGIYSKRFKATGYLSIDEKHIVVAQFLGQPLIVPISNIQEFKISRGATIHYAETENFPPETHDNWISFTFNNKPYKVEFCITNEEENEKFETMIRYLRRTYPDFYYTSI